MFALFGRSASLIAYTFLMSLGAKSAMALTIEFVPQTQIASLGSPASVDVYLNFDGVLNAPFVQDFSVNIDWDSALLSMVEVVFDAYLNGGVAADSTQSAVPGVGSATISETSLLSSLGLCLGTTAGGQCSLPGFRLFTLNFNTLASGTSALAFNSFVANDDFGDPISATLGPNGAVIVPSPGSLPLLGGGLLALAFARCRRRAR
jgi:hypothetical protein